MSILTTLTPTKLKESSRKILRRGRWYQERALRLFMILFVPSRTLRKRYHLYPENELPFVQELRDSFSSNTPDSANTPNSTSSKEDSHEKLAPFLKEIREYNRVVLWGLNKRKHSHTFIHGGYFSFFQRVGVPVLWLENDRENNRYIESNDLVMIPKYIFHRDGVSRHTIRDDVTYILHEIDPSSAREDRGLQPLYEKFLSDKKLNRFINLAAYREGLDGDRNGNLKGGEFWQTGVLWNSAKKTLFQPWGSDHLPWEFLSPVYPRGKQLFVVGTVWGDGIRRGNRKQVEELEQIARENGLEFIQKSNLSFEENVALVRESRLSVSLPAVGQRESGYMPCRVFKNISYGQPTIAPFPLFESILGDSFILGESLEEMVQKTLTLDQESYLDLARRQQEAIREYTYLEMWSNMLTALKRV